MQIEANDLSSKASFSFGGYTFYPIEPDSEQVEHLFNTDNERDVNPNHDAEMDSLMIDNEVFRTLVDGSTSDELETKASQDESSDVASASATNEIARCNVRNKNDSNKTNKKKDKTAKKAKKAVKSCRQPNCNKPCRANGHCAKCLKENWVMLYGKKVLEDFSSAVPKDFENDALIGLGTGEKVKRHPGNIRLKELARKHPEVAGEVLLKRFRDEKRRFLYCLKDVTMIGLNGESVTHRCWYELGAQNDFVARERCMQLLRCTKKLRRKQGPS